MAKDAKTGKDVKNKKHFFKDFKAELKKVIWPTPKQLINKTVAVVVIVLITAAIVFVLDLVFKLLNDQGINKLKSSIRNETVVENTVDNNIDNTTDNTEVTDNVVSVDEIEGEPSEENAE